MKFQRNQKGFTLIEVVLVLAIGGLIFLLAFIAFQQVSINRRDTQRRSDLNRTVAEVQNWVGDHNGSIPSAADFTSTAASGFKATYMKNPTDPKGVSYAFYSATPTTPATNDLVYTIGGTGKTSCSGSPMTNTKDFKVELYLEKGIACNDSTGN
jgi:prepilin-type N-terminal cleavage/methylation domain-containing protein